MFEEAAAMSAEACLARELAGESVERGARAGDRAEVCNALSTHVANLRATRRSGGYIMVLA